MFIEKTIKQEQDEYLKEGISWTAVDYFNNKVVCDLIESRKPAGVIAFLDEECLLGKGTDQSFLDKIEANLKSHAHFDRPREKGKAADSFTVKHYAGDVSYNCANFIDKNKDLVWKDLLLIGESSSLPLMLHATMFPRGGAAGAGLSRPATAGSHFRSQVQTLMDALSRCEPHYIRCIKPNEEKKAGLFSDELNRHQVRYLGLLENVRVRRAGFAFRAPFDRFVRRYKMLSAATWPDSAHLDAADACRKIMAALSIAEGPQFQMGKTKIFIRQPVTLFSLEELRERKLHLLATLIQSVYRAHRTRKYFREMREKSLGLFGRNKMRRRASVRRFYVGDYLGLAGNASVAKLLSKYKDESPSGGHTSSILFADAVSKINRKSKAQMRVLLLTPHALYNLTEGKWKENRRIEIRKISAVSLSKLADNFVVVHVASQYDYVFECERKTELITSMVDAYRTATGSALQLNFVDAVVVANKNKEKQTIRFVKSDSASGVSHAVDPAQKENIVVSVGRLDTVNEAFLKALEPVTMRRTDPALKPKPGYVARNQPTKVRGISISAGQGQKAGGFQQQQQQQQTAAASSSSSSSSSSTPARPAPPAAAAKSPDVYARCVEDFTGSDSRELSFKKGQVVRVLSQDESGWWSSELDGALGYAPSTYLELLPQAPGTNGARRPSMHNAPLPRR